MDNHHVSIDDLGRLARRELAPDTVMTVARHIHECAACAEYARRTMQAHDVPEAFGLDDVGHPTDLDDYVDGGGADREAITAHLEWCVSCREDADDLFAMRAQMRKARRTPFVYAAAAAAIIAVGGVTFFERAPARVVPPRHQPTGTPPPRVAARAPYERAEWETAVNDAVHSGAVAAPRVVRDLRSSLDAFRGNTHASIATLAPAGVLIESTRPAFTWTASHNARYVVSVYDRDRAVATSGSIAIAAWTPRKDLARGRTFTWQVEVFHGAKSDVIPAPPSPPAMFRIVDSATARELDDARALYPGDHLLLGILYARAGLQTRAEEELRAAHTPDSSRILDSVQRW